MDPDVREVFEEYLEANPEIHEQAERLLRARALLCRHGCRRGAIRGVEARVRRRLACEMLHAESPIPPNTASHLGTVVTIASVAVVMLMAGMLVGVALNEESLHWPLDRTTQTATDRPPLPGRALVPLAAPSSASYLFASPRSFVVPVSSSEVQVVPQPDTLRYTTPLQRSYGAP